MKLTDAWKEYKEYTKDLTENGRKLAIAAAAISWLFKSPVETFPFFINLTLISIVLYFFFDLLQYFVTAIVLRNWIRKQEKEMIDQTGKLESDIVKPRWIAKISFKLFFLKNIFLFIAYIWLILEFCIRIA